MAVVCSATDATTSDCFLKLSQLTGLKTIVFQEVLNKSKTTIELSHKKLRAFFKKHRRKLKRQALAKEREQQEKKEEEARGESSKYHTVEEKEREELILEEYENRERERRHKLWLQRDEEAYLEFCRKQELAEKAKKERDELAKKMKEELAMREQEEQEQKDNEEKKKKEKEGDDKWHNPIAPANYSTDQPEKDICPFFMKTGACRFGERCSRSHPYPTRSPTLLIKGLYSHFSIDRGIQDEYDTDIGLEFEECDTYQHFKEFYDDVLPEFKEVGQVVQFKVCCNHEPHLRGNVYIQYASEELAEKAFRRFNGRWYAGKQISCEYTNVQKWKSAICGLFHRNRCPKGKSCNFLHVFKNPRNEFWLADRDMDNESNSKNYDESSRSTCYSHSYRGKRSRSRSRSPKYRDMANRRRRHRHDSPTHLHSPSHHSRRKRKNSHSPSLRHKRKSRRKDRVHTNNNSLLCESTRLSRTYYSASPRSRSKSYDSSLSSDSEIVTKRRSRSSSKSSDEDTKQSHKSSLSHKHKSKKKQKKSKRKNVEYWEEKSTPICLNVETDS